MKPEIIDKLSEKHKLPPEQIKIVINSVYDGLRYYLTNPLETKDGILIHEFLSFYIDEKKITKYIKKLELKDFKNPPRSDENKIDFYTDLLNLKNKYERQKKKPIFNEQFGTGTSEE